MAAILTVTDYLFCGSISILNQHNRFLFVIFCLIIDLFCQQPCNKQNNVRQSFKPLGSLFVCVYFTIYTGSLTVHYPLQMY